MSSGLIKSTNGFGVWEAGLYVKSVDAIIPFC